MVSWWRLWISWAVNCRPWTDCYQLLGLNSECEEKRLRDCHSFFPLSALSLSLPSQSKLLTQQIAESHTSCHAQRLRQSFSDALTSVRQALVTVKRPTTQHTTSLNTHCTSLYAAIKNGLESSLGQLKVHVHFCIHTYSTSRTRLISSTCDHQHDGLMLYYYAANVAQ